MKRAYFPPTMTVEVFQQESHLLAGSLNGVGGNADLDYGGGSTEPAMGREFDDPWDF